MSDISPHAGRQNHPAIAWLIIACCVGVIFNDDWQASHARTNSPGASVFQLEYSARYVLGAARMWATPQVHDQMRATLEESAKTPVLQLRLIPLIGELQGDDQAAEAADKFLASQPPANLVHNTIILRAIYRGKILDAAEADALQTRYGFFGDVAAAH